MKATMLVWVLIAGLLAACGSRQSPSFPVVQNFELPAYLGLWHELARLDHRFERGLSEVTAEYRLHPTEPGRVRVVNRGFDAETGQWREAEGKAYLVGAPNQGALKVSFFGPFYGAYQILALDPEQYSLVAGPDQDYLWILARQPQLSPAILNSLLARAEQLGFNTSALIWRTGSVAPLSGQ